MMMKLIKSFVSKLLFLFFFSVMFAVVNILSLQAHLGRLYCIICMRGLKIIGIEYIH